jgi:hypothetical protein
MRERIFPRRLALMLALAALAPVAHVRGDSNATPTRFGHGDSGLVTAASPVDGRMWSAWVYRSGPETDIAVSVREPDGAWSEPVFLGPGDSRSQLDPALVFDAAGNLYLAHSVRETGQLLVGKLTVGATRMSSLVPVSQPGEKATSPVLMLTDNHLMVAYRSGSRVVLRAVPLVSSQQPFGIQDGPDGFPPTHNETEGEEGGGATGIGL